MSRLKLTGASNQADVTVFFAAAVEFDLAVIWAADVGALMVLLSRPVRDLVRSPPGARVAA
jgi:hypothetical protein